MCHRSSVRYPFLPFFLVLLGLPQTGLAQTTLPVIAPATWTARVQICYDVYCYNTVEALDGNTAIDVSSSGVVGVLTRIGPDTWAGTQVLFNPDEGGPPQGPPMATRHDFGAPVALDGNVLLISGGIEQRRGLIYVFTRYQGVWRHAQTIELPKTPGFSDGVPFEIAMHENTALITAYRSSAVASFEQVHVYTRTVGQPFVYRGVITPALGTAVAIQKNTALLVGAQSDGSNAVYVYERSAQGWTLKQRLVGSGTGPQDGFGTSVAFDNKTIVVSAPDKVNPADPLLPGAVYTFTKRSTLWVQRDVLWHEPLPVPPPFDPAVRFGEVVALSGKRLLVDSGAPLGEPPLVTFYERRNEHRPNEHWDATAHLGCLNIREVLVSGTAAIVTYGDFSKPGSTVAAYELPPFGTPPPPTSFACD